jgi:RHH-type proline utilization regulon transcriptional repressor/proline dehydrogenase/delta 1-pyrroline-5-carboxylate dehydrogenase
MGFTDQNAYTVGPLDKINRRYLAEEQSLVTELTDEADVGESAREKIQGTAATLVRAVRKHAANEGGLDAFLQQYDLSSEEGVLLMCIAEALLRIPDADTADRLIADKITAASWEDHLGESDSLFVNASTWGLMLTGQLLQLDEAAKGNPARYLGKLASRTGEPVVRAAMRQAMRIMGFQFVMGRTIEEALTRAHTKEDRELRYSFDMLGEAALTADDAVRYFESYASAIDSIAENSELPVDINAAPSISVKLSALHPRYEFTQHERVMRQLVPIVTELAEQAADLGIGITIDAEEADRLELSLDLFQRVYRGKGLAGFEGLGLAVQAYQRRATDIVRYLGALAADAGRRIPVRLVKGAYWDTEIKRAQEQGLESYPVFTRKCHSDISYLACARLLLSTGDGLYGQFATHNAHTLASIMHFAGSRSDYEFQRLHGMGEELYDEISDPHKFGKPCRIYAPVGSHEDLLPYLVRRLLENGANTSFVNRILDENIDVKDIVEDPIDETRANDASPHTAIPAPADIFLPERSNSHGYNLADRTVSHDLLEAMQGHTGKQRHAAPIVGGKTLKGTLETSVNPADLSEVVGMCSLADQAAVDRALKLASAAQPDWDRTPAAERAETLDKVAQLFEEHGPELMALCVAEAGKTIPDALSELREAVDFIRYYAAQARTMFGEPATLPGPTGERNTLGMRGRGVFLCISPWNFPLAIFAGQISAALAAGNTVLAKPAEQTPVVAHRAVELFLKAGIPPDVLHFLPGDGAEIGGYAAADNRVAGVAFTGSTETARLINQTLASRDGPIGVLIAETGGQNAMFVDSSALPEQVVIDSVYSAFNSAGQRCSALRVLCLQSDIAPRVVRLLEGHMSQLAIGNPANLSTDVGPTIDRESQAMLKEHIKAISKTGKMIQQCELPKATTKGTFVAPTAIEIDNVSQLKREVFGPVLHIVRYNADKLAQVMDEVNNTGFGLTMGLHSRIDSRARAFVKRSGAGNIYINRNMIGAVVGVQPFGGRGLSGTGPKAGGPHYLSRFGTEVTVSNNITAVGGNASLLSLNSE